MLVLANNIFNQCFVKINLDSTGKAVLFCIIKEQDMRDPKRSPI